MESIFGPIFDAIAFLLAQFYSVIPNLGISIILLTVLIMLALYPLTAKQTKSMMAMQRVQPEIKKLQAKYKGDRTKLNEEMMKFYQENKINPLAGCLPLLVQMPIFISLFNVLRNAYKYVPTNSSLHRALCDGIVSKTGKNICGHDATAFLHAQHPSLQIGDTAINHLHFLGLDLQLSATATHDGFFDAAPYFLLVGLVILTYFLQSRQSAKRTPAANKQMGAVMKVLPMFFGLITVTLPSGVGIYFLVSALFRLGQQEVIFRRHGSVLTAPKGKGALDVKSKERPGAHRGQAAMAELDSSEPDEIDVEPMPEVRAPKPAAARPVPPDSGPRAGGLRGFFALPPPPEYNRGGADTGAGSSQKAAGGGSSAAGTQSGANRRGKKKRKR